MCFLWVSVKCVSCVKWYSWRKESPFIVILNISVGRQKSVENGGWFASFRSRTNSRKFFASLGRQGKLVAHQVWKTRQSSLKHVIHEVNSIFSTFLFHQISETFPDPSVCTASKGKSLVPFGCCDCFESDLKIFDTWLLIFDNSVKTWCVFQVQLPEGWSRSTIIRLQSWTRVKHHVKQLLLHRTCTVWCEVPETDISLFDENTLSVKILLWSSHSCNNGIKRLDKYFLSLLFSLSCTWRSLSKDQEWSCT